MTIKSKTSRYVDEEETKCKERKVCTQALGFLWRAARTPSNGSFLCALLGRLAVCLLHQPMVVLHYDVVVVGTQARHWTNGLVWGRSSPGRCGLGVADGKCG